MGQAGERGPQVPARVHRTAGLPPETKLGPGKAPALGDSGSSWHRAHTQVFCRPAQRTDHEQKKRRKAKKLCINLCQQSLVWLNCHLCVGKTG